REDQGVLAIEDLSLVPCRWKKCLTCLFIGDHDKGPRLQTPGRCRKNERVFQCRPTFRRNLTCRIELLHGITPVELCEKFFAFDRVHDLLPGKMTRAGAHFHLEICALSGNLIATKLRSTS